MPSITPQTPPDFTVWPKVNPRFNKEDVVVLGVDPGGADGEHQNGHVGVALASRFYQPNGTLQWPGWRVYETAEMNPDAFIRWFSANTEGIDVIFGEMFRPDRDRAMALVGSTMPTSQLIGWIRMHCMLQAPHMQVNWQSNMVLTGPTAAILREKKIKPVSPKGANAAKGSTGDHQRSAELHLWHGLMREGLVDGITGS